MTSFVNNSDSNMMSYVNNPGSKRGHNATGEDDYEYLFQLSTDPEYWVEFWDFLSRWLRPLVRMNPTLLKIREVCESNSPLSLVLSTLGTVTNLINILVFFRHGLLTDSCTASLFGLAVSDFCFCFIQFIGSLGETITHFIDRVDMEFNYYIYLDQLRELLFQYISAWITALISVERMISVTLPFQSKSIFTPKRSLLAIFCISLVFFLINSPRLLYLKVAWYGFTHVNIPYGLHLATTGLISESLDRLIEEVVETYIRPICVSIVLICNVVIIAKVKLSARFRKEATSSSFSSSKLNIKTKTKNLVGSASTTPTTNDYESKRDMKETGTVEHSKKISEHKTNKELKLIRMMVVLCITFFVSHSLNIVSKMIRTVAQYSYKHVGRHFWFSFRDFVEAMTSLGFTLETFNAATNIVIYYAMSSRYRKELKQQMRRVHKKCCEGLWFV